MVEQVIRNGRPASNDFDKLLNKFKVAVMIINIKDIILIVKGGKKVGRMGRDQLSTIVERSF